MDGRLCRNVLIGRGTANMPVLDVSNFAKRVHFLPVNCGPAVDLQL
jgi:hypothetical protein